MVESQTSKLSYQGDLDLYYIYVLHIPGAVTTAGDSVPINDAHDHCGERRESERSRDGGAQ